MSTTILTLIGSLRADSINRRLAEAALEAAGSQTTVRLYEGLNALPFYNEDIDVEGGVPDAARLLREAAASADAVLVVCPEYNGTMPAVLKNAIDWLSRPFGAGALTGKPTAVIGSAFGQYGGVWAHDEARRALGIAGAKVLEQERLAIGGSATRFAAIHPREDAETMQALGTILAALEESSRAA